MSELFWDLGGCVGGDRAIVGGGMAAKIGELIPKPQLLGDLNFPEPLAR